MWKRFVTNNFQFTIENPQYYRACIINVLLLLTSVTLLLFSIYNMTITNYYKLSLVEFITFLIYMGLICYFHKTSNLKITSCIILLLLYIFLAIYVAINKNLEYGLYWLSIFPTIAVFLLGYKFGSIISILFFSYFSIFMFNGYRSWEASTFNTISIVNIVFASAFIILFISYFDITLENARRSLVQKTSELEEEHAMLDRHIIVYTLDLAGTIQFASKAFYNVSGYNEKEFIGQNHRIIYQETDSGLFNDMWYSVGKGKVWSSEVKSNKKDGAPYWLFLTIEPILNSSGECIRYRAIGKDITYRKKIEELAVSDYLTKLTNRAKLDEELTKEILRAARYEVPFCIILLDVDYFKNVNDYYGHQKGDYVLKEIAGILRQNTRRVDTVGRWGGEEFLIITPSTTLDNGVLMAEKLRLKIEGHDFGIDSQTASFGVAKYRSEDIIETLIERVDKALYKAKKNGRNQVVDEEWEEIRGRLEA